METEYEAKFLDIDKDEMRDRLKQASAVLVRPEFLQRRWVFDLPMEKRKKGVWMRVRDEGDKITMTWKSHIGNAIADQKEIELVVNSFDRAVELLQELGCVPESYQETRRELWKLDDAKITIDSWPFLKPLVEIEADSEELVRTAADKLEFHWPDALFCGATQVYKMKFGENVEIRKMPKLTFDMPDPFRRS